MRLQISNSPRIRMGWLISRVIEIYATIDPEDNCHILDDCPVSIMVSWRALVVRTYTYVYARLLAHHLGCVHHAVLVVTLPIRRDIYKRINSTADRHRPMSATAK